MTACSDDNNDDGPKEGAPSTLTLKGFPNDFNGLYVVGFGLKSSGSKQFLTFIANTNINFNNPPNYGVKKGKISGGKVTLFVFEEDDADDDDIPVLATGNFTVNAGDCSIYIGSEEAGFDSYDEEEYESTEPIYFIGGEATISDVTAFFDDAK